MFTRDHEIEQAAAKLYRSDLPYHNFKHAMHTVEAAELIIRRCEQEGVRVDAQVVYYALVFHDAGFHQDPTQFGCATKEDYSAKLAGKVLAERGVAPRVIEKVAKAIDSTRRDAPFKTTEQKAVRAADLAGLAADYKVFRGNTERLRQEHALLTGESIPWPQWVDMAYQVVRFYLDQEIRLTSYFSNQDGKSDFHTKVRQNLAKLKAEREPANQ